MQEETLVLSEDEKQLIKNRRLLSEIRLASPAPAAKNPEKAPQKPTEAPKDAILGTNRPPGWDSHTDVGKTHKGRLTTEHPFAFFEEEIFKKIKNMAHQKEHKKITEVLGMPVQANNRDRVYHLLCHMDVLWYEKRLPLKYKKLQEGLKQKHNIGPDNISLGQKKKGVVYPFPKVELPKWDVSKYTNIDETELFTGEVLNYSKYA